MRIVATHKEYKIIKEALYTYRLTLIGMMEQQKRYAIVKEYMNTCAYIEKLENIEKEQKLKMEEKNE